MSAVSQQPNIKFHNIFRKSCGATAAQMRSSRSFSSRLGRSGEGRSRHSVIADSGNPLPHSSSAQMNSDSRAIYNCRPSSPRERAPRFSVHGRKAQGYLWSNHYTISSPQRPSLHPSLCRLPSLPFSLTLSLLSLSFSLSPSIFHPISVLSASLCILSLTPRHSVGCNCCTLASRRFRIIRRGGRDVARFSVNNSGRMRTSLILPQINRLWERCHN